MSLHVNRRISSLPLGDHRLNVRDAMSRRQLFRMAARPLCPDVFPQTGPLTSDEPSRLKPRSALICEKTFLTSATATVLVSVSVNLSEVRTNIPVRKGTERETGPGRSAASTKPTISIWCHLGAAETSCFKALACQHTEQRDHLSDAECEED